MNGTDRFRCGVLVPAILLVSCAAAAAQPVEMPDFLHERQPRAKLLLLGMFHFQDAGLDEHKPNHGFDALSEARQKEIEEVLSLLEAYRPTVIGVEVRASRQKEIDDSYAKFLAGEKTLTANEIHQIGFRLGKRLGLVRLHAIDAQQRPYDPDMTEEDYQARAASLLEGVAPERLQAEAVWDERFTQMYTWEDSLVTRQTLREHLIFANDEKVLLRHHGHYLVGSFKLGRGDDYFGADLKTAWYNRNLRIFQNIVRATTAPEDRILVIIGAGHVPILRHAAQASPDYELVEVRDALRLRAGESRGGVR